MWGGFGERTLSDADTVPPDLTGVSAVPTVAEVIHQPRRSASHPISKYFSTCSLFNNLLVHEWGGCCKPRSDRVKSRNVCKTAVPAVVCVLTDTAVLANGNLSTTIYPDLKHVESLKCVTAGSCAVITQTL